MLRKSNARRGVVILVVLSLLVLFVLLVVTFAIVAGQYRRTALAYARQEVLGPEPQKDLDRAFYELLRDTTFRSSSLRFHSLLRDYYGGDGFGGVLRSGTELNDVNTTNPPNPPASTNTYRYSGQQLMDLVVNLDPANGVVVVSTDGVDLTATRRNTTGYYRGLRDMAGYYKGCVLTIVSGKAKGASTRIVGYDFVTLSGVRYPYFRVVAPRTDTGEVLSPSDLGGAAFVVNGRPFSGTGFGLDASNGLSALDAVTSQPASLVPNYASLPVIPRTVDRGTGVSEPGPPPLIATFRQYGPPLDTHFPTAVARVLNGDADEGYDAADFQNMFLAILAPSPTGAGDIIPSFHRPALMNYFEKTFPALWANPNFRRRISLRPIEPNFDGSNSSYPRFGELNGPWDRNYDVDNDGDGIPDSIWVDLGFPLQTAPDGRRYKPLFAILCTDLDGRLNVNAHDRKRWFTPSVYATVADGTTNTVTTPRGLSYGPPEILIDGAGITGNLTGLLDNRYGDGYPGASGYDLQARLRFFEESQNYFFPGTYGRSSYSSPADLRAELAFGVNAYGQPAFEELDDTVTEARADSPYEVNLIDGGADNAFTPAEMERLLRRFDHDVEQLPKRLSEFISNWNLTTSPNGRIVTTASFDPPVPAHGIPKALADEAIALGVDLSTIHSFADLLAIRLSTGGATNVATELSKMLWTDAAAGLRMDINRPLGNGRDNNSNSIVDEMGEQSSETIYADVATAANTAGLTQLENQFTNTPLWHVNGLSLNRLLARQLLARHLYVLTLTLCDIDSTSVDANLAREIAQWAINVVDFRDADSAMTPFEYDGNPFNGWSPDGDLTTTGDRDGGGVVWGCERPELLLTEAFAFHDRRTYDTALDPVWQKTTNDPDPDPDDPDYDQKYVPFATAFVELYNPWMGTDTEKTPPEELYRGMGGVALSSTTSGGTPVWRLLICNENDGIIEPALNPDDPANPLTVDRTVYFVNDLTNAPASGRRRYYTSLNVSPVLPGQYAVVGGGLPSSNADLTVVSPETAPVDSWWVSPTGDVDPASGGANPPTHPRRIALQPSSNTIAVYNNGGTTATTTLNIGSVIVPNRSDVTDPDGGGVYAKVVTAFNVSEPSTGYPKTHGNSTVDFTSRLYVNVSDGVTELPLDIPLDKEANEFPAQVAAKNGTTRGFARVYLQRLANPMMNWDAQTNPYRTIDSIPLDLTAFNGLYSFTHADDPDAAAPAGAVVDFATLQRGDSDSNATTGTDARRLWPQERVKTTTMAAAQPSMGGFFFPYPFIDNNTPPKERNTLGQLNTAYQAMPNPQRTFPWLVWNNRPYTSHYELLQVPRHNSWNLLRVDENDADLRSDYWLPTEMPAGSSPYEDTAVQGQYPYLVNFFYSQTDPLNAHRLFDYLHVPSRFVGAEMVLNSNYFGKTTNFAQPNLTSFGLLPPFNRISRYRDPGRVNINTIMNDKVWDAITGGRGPTYAQLAQSRQGTVGDSIPTAFANPFRPSGSNSHVPLTTMKQTRDIDVTLLREHPSTSGQALMESSGMGNLATDPRNSFFRYELLHRLGNMVTTRSNVYAIWITVGYFEVEPNLLETPSGSGNYVLTYDDFHPDGLRVAQELGLDTAQVRRHRAFFMVDRTIPVAFEPGENHNVDKCVLLRRFIE